MPFSFELIPMNKLDEQIAKFKVEKQQAERIQNYIKVLNRNIEDTQKEIDSLKSRYVEEVEDVQKIQDKSLSAIFRKVLGTDQEALEKERQEVLWAYMSLEKAQKSLELLRYEKSVLVRQLIGLEYEEEKFQELLKKKEELLKQYPQMRIKLTLIDHKLEKLMIEDKEIREVTDILKDLHDLFIELNKQLDQITNWNQSKKMYHGKGHYSSYQKKQYVKRNQALIPKIEILKDKLNMELKDLKKNYEINLTYNLTMLNNFFVLFMDNLITDWIVRGGISSTRKTVELSLSKLDALGMMLKYELNSINLELEQLKKERLTVIINESGENPGPEKEG